MLNVMARDKKSATESVRIRTEIARKARIIAAYHDVSMPDYLESVLMPILEKEYARVVALMSEEKDD